MAETNEYICPAELVCEAYEGESVWSGMSDAIKQSRANRMRSAFRALAERFDEWPISVNGAVSDALTDWENMESNNSNDIPIAFLLEAAKDGEKPE